MHIVRRPAARRWADQSVDGGCTGGRKAVSDSRSEAQPRANGRVGRRHGPADAAQTGGRSASTSVGPDLSGCRIEACGKVPCAARG